MPEINETPMTVYEIMHSNGDIRTIEVPTSWKVTFGPAVVLRSSSANNYYATRTTAKTMPMAIRFYESKDQQRAIFTEVISFRDVSLRMQVRPTRSTSEQFITGTETVRGHVYRQRGPTTVPNIGTEANFVPTRDPFDGIDE